MKSGKMKTKPDDVLRRQQERRANKCRVQTGAIPIGKTDMRNDGQRKVDALKAKQAKRARG